MTTTFPPLVSAEWLSIELGAPDLLVLDATLFLPEHGRDARAEFEAEHLPGALFMDLARFQPLPEPERLAAMLAEFGARVGVRAVVYDHSPLRSAARGWWLLRHAGVDAAVLDGGLAAWIARGRMGEPRAAPATPSAAAGITGGSSPAQVRKDDVLASGLPIVDARGPARFRGDEPEPRPGVAPGHIPGSRNLHYGLLFRADGTYEAPDELRAAFASAGVDPAAPMIATCGSGVTASNLVLAAALLGNEDVRLYDGSWAEWGADPGTPKARGPA